MHLLQRLLGRTQGRRVGSGATQHTHHVGQAYARQPHGQQGNECAQQDDAYGQQVERGAALTERTDKTRTHLKAQRIDKEHQSETLGIGEHVVVNGQAEATGQNAAEKYESYAQREAAHVNFAQHEPYGTYQANDDYGLYVCRKRQDMIEPFHSSVFML